jgi:hypothetical protein
MHWCRSIFKGTIQAAIGALCLSAPAVAADPSWWTQQDRDEAQARADERAERCKLPRARSGEVVTLLGVYEGDTQPTVAVAGQDESTGLVRVEIEAGPEPIYLILAAYEPTIWQFEGAVGRLARVVAIPGSIPESHKRWAGTAVLGLAREQVKFSAPRNCGGYFYDPESVEGIAMTKAVKRAIGRAPDRIIGHYSAAAVSVPSGEPAGPGYFTFTEVLKDGEIVDADTDWGGLFNGGWELIRQEDWLAKPGGIEAIDPEAVLAPGHVETYQVLPAQDGLRQLVAEGKLLRRDGMYRIVQPIPRFPPGLSGSHMVQFLLATGVPMPKGDLGHSSLVVEGEEWP